ncbi:Pyridine nucleotide-disulfide oxidoreductase domain-containing protein 1-like protein [Dinothrombium tinctorium]|uniref:Pyridine nucleotide-disulfide oxidoreductase domain-containing protein 1 n=1 Tax=Dinothrombium tinctorium TaxID=1965070 RepID=A0A3S3R037_9ACAR|nr:Pyridine nucleotide-disulfide oxidoreductase domain-containing protein 1-like protein [Dinothrombium tinctorium]
MIVVVGGGIAGVSCVETLLAETNGSVPIALITNSSIVKVASNVIKSGINLESFEVKEQQKTFLEHHQNLRVVVDYAVSVDSDNHEVILKNGEPIKYTKLCICTGGRPNLIATNTDKVLGIRDTETVEQFEQKLKEAKRIAIVGNGGIALELVYTIEHCEVVWIIKDKSIGTPFFQCDAAQFLMPSIAQKPQENAPVHRLKYIAINEQRNKEGFGSALGPDWKINLSAKGKFIERKNIIVEFECEVNSINESDSIPNEKISKSEFDKWPVFVELTNNKLYGCDFVVSATGVIPNVLPLSGTKSFKLASDGGIEVNEEMLTSEINVYAAGDVCTASWRTSRNWFQMRLWTQARQMGIYAAFCMLSHLRNESPQVYFPFDVFTHITRFFDYKVVLLGCFNGQNLEHEYEILLRITEGKEYVKVVVSDNKVQGAILIGETDLEETFENLIVNQLDISTIKDNLLESNIDIEDYFD